MTAIAVALLIRLPLRMLSNCPRHVIIAWVVGIGNRFLDPVRCIAHKFYWRDRNCEFGTGAPRRARASGNQVSGNTARRIAVESSPELSRRRMYVGLLDHDCIHRS